MKTILTYALGVCAFMNIGCTKPISDNEYADPKYPVTYEAEVKVLNDNLLLSCAGSMQLFGDYIVYPAITPDSKGTMQLLSAKDGSLLRSFGYLGRGGNELADYHQFSIDDKGVFYAMDYNHKMVGYDLQALAEGANDYTVISKQFDSSQPTSNQFQIRNENIIHLEDRLNLRIFITTMEGDTLAKYDQYPKITDRYPFDEEFTKKYMRHHGYYTVSPDGKRIALSNGYGMMMEILSVADSGIKSERVRYFYEPEMKSVREPEETCVFGTSQIESTDKYIYVMYYKEQCQALENARPVIGVFDWEGEEVACYNLPVQPFTFAVTPDDKRIYCWVYNPEGEDYLGYFDVK